MSRRSSGTWLRLCLVIFAVVSALAVCGPALYWRFKKTVRFVDSKSSCPPCICDCPPPLSLLKIAPGLANLSVTDCGSNDPDLKKEMEKQFVDLLTEELKLQEAVAEEHTRHMNITFGEAKRVASQYQREAEKCIAAIETCEGARERAEALLIKERKVTTIWEQRARQMGWEAGNMSLTIPSLLSGPRTDIFDPFSVWDLSDEFFNSALANTMSSSSSVREASAIANARVDWKETPEARVFKADLPGLKKEEVKVEVEEGRVLQISGERSKEQEEKNDKWHRVERSSGKFLRRFRLPENAKMEQVKASMENGLLTVTVPKVEDKKPEVKAIEISG